MRRKDERDGSRREMGRGWPSLHELPVRCAALRNPGHGSRKLSILKLNRKAKPFVRMGHKENILRREMLQMRKNLKMC